VFILVFRVWISELEHARITIEEVKPLLSDHVEFHHDNCTIDFSIDDNHVMSMPIVQRQEVDTCPSHVNCSNSIIHTMDIYHHSAI
jgi:hypothetical protein